MVLSILVCYEILSHYFIVDDISISIMKKEATTSIQVGKMCPERGGGESRRTKRGGRERQGRDREREGGEQEREGREKEIWGGGGGRGE